MLGTNVVLKSSGSLVRSINVYFIMNRVCEVTVYSSFFTKS